MLSLEYWMKSEHDERELSPATVIAPLSNFLKVEHLELGVTCAFGDQTPDPDNHDDTERFGKDNIQSL